MSRLFSLAMASFLFGCHPQAAGPGKVAQLRPLNQELVENAVRARISDLSVCLIDTDVVPGQSTTWLASMQLSINDMGRVQDVTLKRVTDSDVHECITRKTKEWAFPGGGLTIVEVQLRFQAKTAIFSDMQIQPFTRTAATR